MLHARLSGLQAIILRVGNPFGPYQLRGVTIGSIARFVQLHATAQQLHIWGDGSVVRDYLHIDDFSSALADIVRTPEFPSGVYNLASGSGHSLRDILEEIRRVSGRAPAASFEAQRVMDVPAIVLDISRLRRALPRRKPRVSFSDGITHVADRFKLVIPKEIPPSRSDDFIPRAPDLAELEKRLWRPQRTKTSR